MLFREKVVIAVIIIVLLAVAGLFGYKFYEKKQNEDMFEGMTKGELTQLLDRKAELESEIAYINSEMEYSGTGPLVVLFAQPASKLEEEAIPQMKKRGYSAVIAVSEKYFPGDKNCLSGGMTKALLDEGWEIVISCTKSTDIEGLCKKLNKAGLGKPAAAYYSSGRTQPDKEALKKQGITTIIRYNIAPENYLNENEDNTLGIIAYGCNAEGRVDVRQQTLDKGETFVYEIGFLNERNQCGNIRSWISSLKRTAADEGFKVSNISEAVAMEKENARKLREENEELYQQRQQDIKELNEVNRQIAEK